MKDTIALDYRSARTYDADGRLHVDATNISKANVCPCLGSEIPGYRELGLDAGKVYRLLRHPDELRKGADTFNNVPLMIEHVPVSADDHQPGKVVGATGTNATFDGKYLRNSLVVWARDAIDGIEAERQKELSCAYRYDPVMRSGTYKGEAYDGIMTNIVANHVALVAQGRAGADVMVGDSKMYAKQSLEMAFDAKAYLNRFPLDRETRRRLGMARDEDDESETFSDNPSSATVDKMIRHAHKNFSPGDWNEFEAKVKNHHAQVMSGQPGDADVDAMDEPPPFKGQAKRPGLGADALVAGSLAEADFIRRYPGALRIRHDTMGTLERPIPTPKECVQRGRVAAGYDDAAGYYARFPGARRIRII